MSGRLKVGVVLVGIAIALVVVAVLFLDRYNAVPGKAVVQIGNSTLTVDVASTPEAQHQGLGGRASLGPNEGMLFTFPSADLYGFWMKDMRFPLDFVWIAGNRIVGFEQNVDPQIGATDAELRNYYPSSPVDKVLELSAGRVQSLGVQVGDTVSIHPLMRPTGS